MQEFISFMTNIYVREVIYYPSKEVVDEDGSLKSLI